MKLNPITVRVMRCGSTLALPLPTSVAEMLGIEQGDLVKYLPQKEEPHMPPESISREGSIEITLTPAAIEWPHIPIRTKDRKIFPPDKQKFIMEFEGESKELHVASNKIAVGEWFKKHNLKPRDKVIVKVIEPWKRYSLQFNKR